MTVDRLKSGFVTGDYGRSDTASGKRDQHIHGQIPHLGTVIMLTLPDHTQGLCSLNPMSLRGGEDLASLHQVHDEPPLNLRLRSAKEFMKHDRRAADDER
ncbi:MAG: hypothetical protein NW703_10875 [Nitrospiraceae bacterium]